MTHFRSLLLALCALFVVVPAGAAQQLASLNAPAPVHHASSAGLIHTIGLENIFVQFGQTISLSPRSQGITDPAFLATWESSALRAFGDERLKARLEAGVARSLDESEIISVDAFLTSPFGRRVTQLEQAGQAIAPDRRLAALAKGQTLYWRVAEHRRAQFDELLELSGAEMTFAVLRESLRGMALGLHLSAGGDIETPWEEIDDAVQLQLAGMQQSLVEAARAALAYTYADLTDDEMESYLTFLRTPAARKFYGNATLAIGAIIRETMAELGETVAGRLRRVDI